MILEVPVDPDADEAREWLVRELSKPSYREAEPSWFDRLVSGFWDWLTGLFGNGVDGSPSLIWALVLLVLIGALVAAYFIFGPPRVNRRSTVTGAIFGDDDGRDAAAIRRAAERAAALGDWALAIEEMFRSVARGLSERSILTTSPGTTATGFAARARDLFPGLDGPLTASAASFDGVRYLDRPGSESEYVEVAELERTLRSSKPRPEPAGVAG